MFKPLLLIILLGISIVLGGCGTRNEIKTTTAKPHEAYNLIDIKLDTSFYILRDIRAAEKIKKIENLLQKKYFNGCILVAQEGQVLYKNAFGFANYRKRQALNVQTDFQLASVSKQFTAVAVMMMKEQGKLNYDDNINRFYPDFPYKNITIRMLLTHRSGLSEYMWFCDHITDRRTPINNQDLINLMINKRPGINFNPNRRHDYSNTGYAVLAAIVEKLTGMPFPSFMKKNVFDPLGMKNTFIFTFGSLDNKTNIATGHLSNWFPSGHDYLDGVTGDKGVYSCVDDLFKWDQGLYTGKIVQLSTLEEAYTPANKEFKGKRNYGFGWRTNIQDDDSKVVFHAGLWHGFCPYFARRLCDKSTIIVLSNKRGWDASVVSKIFKILDE
jgi:CubicO group peptidase (beta-lactamase class C family)